MTKSELIQRIAQTQPDLVERDVALAVNMMLEHMDGAPFRRRPNRDPWVRQLLVAFSPCARRAQSQDRNAGITSGEICSLLQAGNGVCANGLNRVHES